MDAKAQKVAWEAKAATVAKEDSVRKEWWELANVVAQLSCHLFAHTPRLMVLDCVFANFRAALRKAKFILAPAI